LTILLLRGLLAERRNLLAVGRPIDSDAQPMPTIDPGNSGSSRAIPPNPRGRVPNDRKIGRFDTPISTVGTTAAVARLEQLVLLGGADLGGNDGGRGNRREGEDRGETHVDWFLPDSMSTKAPTSYGGTGTYEKL
jgi:hypothetical protein